MQSSPAAHAGAQGSQVGMQKPCVVTCSPETGSTPYLVAMHTSPAPHGEAASQVPYSMPEPPSGAGVPQSVSMGAQLAVSRRQSSPAAHALETHPSPVSSQLVPASQRPSSQRQKGLAPSATHCPRPEHVTSRHGSAGSTVPPSGRVSSEPPSRPLAGPLGSGGLDPSHAGSASTSTTTLAADDPRREAREKLRMAVCSPSAFSWGKGARSIAHPIVRPGSTAGRHPANITP